MIDALVMILDPVRFLLLAVGVLAGLGIGVIPGLGGLVGLSILIPFTYSLDPFAAFALLMGMAAVTTTSDTIPAVLFGVPGTVGSAATVIDGHALAKQGQAARAFGAGYTASLIGGIAGALLLTISIPALRPMMLYIGSPEMFAFAVFGLSMVAVLSGGTPFKGLAAGAIGLMIAMIGANPQTGTLRWTFGSLYLWEGLPLVPVTLGLFALPELADLVIRRTRIAQSSRVADFTLSNQWAGICDACRHWWLVLRCSWLGAALGAIPGIGSAVVDWVAYGHAARTEKRAGSFGQGDIRGVIAPESANNAKEGGALVPTLAFGVPGSASMALLLGAFVIQGLVPGPAMLTTHLDVTYAIIWSLVLANVLGALICLVASGPLAKLAQIRYGLLVPVVLALVVVGAFQGSRHWGDLYLVLACGVLGWLMKRFGWPRPPLVLGFVLGDIFERYLFISIEAYGTDWLFRPIVVVILSLALWGLYRPLQRSLAGSFDCWSQACSKPFALNSPEMFTAVIILLVAVALVPTLSWQDQAALVPQVAGVAALAFASAALMTERHPLPSMRRGGGHLSPLDSATEGEVDGRGIVLTQQSITRRAVVYFTWLAGFLVLTAAVGLIVAVPIFITLFARVVGDERWRTAVPVAILTTAACWLIFHRLLAVPWPRSLLGDLFPAARSLTGFL
ncbi:MAG: tripartite tricarboxylate transporter permease [Geminicoccaceae bacterium]